MQVNGQYNDAGLWVGFTLDFDLKKKFHAGLDLQSRWNENISEARSNFIEPWVSKDWSDRFSTTLSYRIIARRTIENLYEPRDRVTLDFKYKTKIKDLKLQYRLRTQKQFETYNEGRFYETDFMVRHRFKFGYKISKRWDYAVLGEPYFARNTSGEWTFTDLRFRTSFEFKLKKRNYLSFGYLIQREYNRTNPLTEFNAMLGYTWIIK